MFKKIRNKYYLHRAFSKAYYIYESVLAILDHYPISASVAISRSASVNCNSAGANRSYKLHDGKYGKKGKKAEDDSPLILVNTNSLRLNPQFSDYSVKVDGHFELEKSKSMKTYPSVELEVNIPFCDYMQKNWRIDVTTDVDQVLKDISKVIHKNIIRIKSDNFMKEVFEHINENYPDIMADLVLNDLAPTIKDPES